MRWLLAAALAACGSSGSGPTAVVVAMAGTEPAAGVTVLSHAQDGTAIDRQNADATGHATIVTDAGGYASVIFPATLEPSTTNIAVITAPIPVSGELDVTGPPRERSPVVVGALAITAPPLAADAGYDVDLGCVTVALPALPATIDVTAACLGSDANLDVLVRGYHSPGDAMPLEVMGYSAARVPLVAGVANLDIAAWDTTGPTIPVTLDGVTPTLALEVTADGLAFPTLPVTDHATLWNGLAVDATRVTANLGFATLGAITTRTQAGAPAAITFGAGDFLPELASTVLLDDRATVAIRWSAIGFAADSLDLHVTWTPGPSITWDVLLPPDADHARFPALDADLAGAIVLPSSPAIDIASDLRAIVTRPDEVLTSHAAGFR